MGYFLLYCIIKPKPELKKYYVFIEAEGGDRGDV